jgi:perosamine synthetase
MELPDIQIAHVDIGEKERAAVGRVLASGQLVQGTEVEAFERELAGELAGTAEAVAVSSGTTALELTLLAMGLGEGDEIVTTPFTFAATINAALRAGAIVRFADVGNDLNLDPMAAAEAVTDRTKAILPVHLYGSPADMGSLAALGRPVLEDAAQAHLATLHGDRVGGLGAAGCFSFYPSKNMTTGEGGAVTTDDGGLAERIRVLRHHGMRRGYEYLEVGTNARMTEVAAAIGRVQLQRLRAWTAHRRRVARRYLEELSGVEGITLPSVPDGAECSWHLFTIRVGPGVDRGRFLSSLKTEGIYARVYYPHILADVGLYRDHPRVDASLSMDRARAAARSVVSLPVHPHVDAEAAERVIAAVPRAVVAARGDSP